MNFVVGFIGMALGGAIVIYSEQLLNFFGRIDFFEKWMRMFGGSRLGYKIFGLIIFFLSLLIFIDLFGAFMWWILGPLLPQNRIAPGV